MVSPTAYADEAVGEKKEIIGGSDFSFLHEINPQIIMKTAVQQKRSGRGVKKSCFIGGLKLQKKSIFELGTPGL
jgi:hypothetical protein